MTRSGRAREPQSCARIRRSSTTWIQSAGNASRTCMTLRPRARVASAPRFSPKPARATTTLLREVQRLLEQPLDTAALFDSSTARPRLLAHDVRDLTGTRLGAFEVRALIGRGGMGEVYRAHDTKLGRDVAIKVLPSAFTADAGSARKLRTRSARACVAQPPAHRVDPRCGRERRYSRIGARARRRRDARGRSATSRIVRNDLASAFRKPSAMHARLPRHSKRLMRRESPIAT